MREFITMVKNTFNYTGRTRRREYWVASFICSGLVMFFYGLMFLGATIAGDCLFYNTGTSIGYSTQGSTIATILCVPYILASLFTFIETLSLNVRRFHDVGKPGWAYALCLLGTCCCGIGAIVQLVFCFFDSKEDNQWGINPKNDPEHQYDNNVSIIVTAIVYVVIFIFATAACFCNMMMGGMLY